jgi:hypothetical protein
MPTTYTLLRQYTIHTPATGVTFNNIPSTYTDLKLVTNATHNDGSETGMYLTINDSTSSFSGIYMYGNVNPASSGSLGRYVGTVSGALYPNTTEITFRNYSSTSYQKQFYVDNATESNSTSYNMNRISGLWASTSAINSIKIDQSGNFGAGSTFYLYGIDSTSSTTLVSPKAYGGDIITYDGTYWYHTFLTSGIFTPEVTLKTAEAVYIAGGGGGGSYRGGGGGAGGMTYQNNLQFSLDVPYPIIVGGGGNGGNQRGGTGNNSALLNLIAYGGGGGGSAISAATATGGNGGSGGGGVSASWAGGTGVAGQGFAGGTGDATYSGKYGAGGGGGAAAAGSNGTSSSGGAGGSGNSSSVFAAATGTGSSGYYAGGGAGGGIFSSPTVGSSAGGGGNSPINSSGGAGLVNTGSGGGGANSTNDGTQHSGGNGASGIVMIRYS